MAGNATENQVLGPNQGAQVQEHGGPMQVLPQMLRVTCPCCTHNKPSHRLLKIHRYFYHFVVYALDIYELGINDSRILVHKFM